LRQLLFSIALTIWLGVAGSASATVNIVGTPMASGTIRAWGNTFQATTGIGVAYVEALEEVSTTELFVGLYDMAVVEYPLSDYRLLKYGLVQFPLLATGVVVVANVPGVSSGALRLDAPVLAAIYMGKITHWDDARIAEMNHGLALPHLEIVPIAQSDGSAVTFNFTRFLAAGSATWRQEIGLGSGLIWPLGPGEKDAVSSAKKLRATEGAVGFQPWMTIQRFDLPVVQLQNAQGAFVKPTPDSFVNAFRAYLALPRSDFMAAVNMAGAESWPILAVMHGQMKRIPEDVPDAMENVQLLRQVLSARVPPAAGLISVSYGDIAAELNKVQSSKQFGPPSRRKGGS
jgi:phosphate transport system substrate-binding protein